MVGRGERAGKISGGKRSVRGKDTEEEREQGIAVETPAEVYYAMC